MGAGSSTRKITLVNDDKAGVIKLSESLAQRLRGQIENGKGPPEREMPLPPAVSSPQPVAPPFMAPSIAPPPIPPSYPTTTEHLEPQFPSEGGGVCVSDWSSSLAQEAHLALARLREEKGIELALQEERWRGRIKEREKQYAEMTQLSAQRLQSTAKEVESLFSRVSCAHVCADAQREAMRCYQDHPRESLRCAKEVDAFARCVDLSRLQSFAKERASS